MIFLGIFQEKYEHKYEDGMEIKIVLHDSQTEWDGSEKNSI